MAMRGESAGTVTVADVRASGASRREFRCGVCGYGVALAGSPPACPMCRATAWEPVPWRPFTRLADVPTRAGYSSDFGL
ncbi:MAG: hypothetical protein M3304_10830 [Actinomycetota bacterium]|nr:hypothetical protein [Actinomycetota bacterium]